MASSLEQTAARSPTSPSSTAATLGRLHPVYGGVDPAEPGELAAGLLPGPGRGPTHRAFSRAESSQEAAVSELREALPCSPRCSSSAGSPWMERLVLTYLCICVFVYLCICVFVMFGKRIYSAYLGLGKWMANGQVGGSPRPGALARSRAANLKI